MSDKFVLFFSGLESEEGIRTQGRAACRDGVKRDGIPGKQRVVYVVLPSSAEPKKSKAPRSDMEFACGGAFWEFSFRWSEPILAARPPERRQ